MSRAFPLRVLLPTRSIACRTLANGLHVETDQLRGTFDAIAQTCLPTSTVRSSTFYSNVEPISSLLNIYIYMKRLAGASQSPGILTAFGRIPGESACRNVAFTLVPKTLPHRLPQSVESTRGKNLDGSVPKTSVLRTVRCQFQWSAKNWSLQECRLDNSRKRCNITSRDPNPQPAFPKQTK
jgi:hypothetical protein